jgi:threonine synthase
MISIGNTSLIKLEQMTEPSCSEIFVKYEGGNPTGCMKDRIALSMIEGAERNEKSILETRNKQPEAIALYGKERLQTYSKLQTVCGS